MNVIGVSILNFQAAAKTILCVKSLLRGQADAADDYSLAIHVADNASGPGDFELLEQGLGNLPGVSLHHHDRNLGFAAGHNRNIGRLLSGEPPDFIWLLNNDCLVASDTARSLLNCAKLRPAVGIWGATLLEDDGLTIQCAGGCFYQKWSSSYRQYGKGKSLKDIEKLKEPCFDYVAGASMFMPSATLREWLDPPPGSADYGTSRWLNEEFFLYFEELDLAKRLHKEKELGWCRAAKIRHSGGSGTGAVQGSRSRKAEYHSTISALKFTRMHHPAWFWIMVPVRFLAKALQLLTVGQAHLIGAVINAYSDYYSGKSRNIS